MRMACTLVVRAPDRATLERRTERLRQRVKDLGAEVRLLRWEQRAGWLAVAPLRRPRSLLRGQRVETGTVARTNPFSAGTLAIEGGGAVRRGGLHRRHVLDSGTPQQESAHVLVRNIGRWQGLLVAGDLIEKAGQGEGLLVTTGRACG
jgi:hypothetical protein